MHLFPQLRKLEDKYPGELAVVGVHSAKFLAEKSTTNLRKAVLRYDITHPVVNDRDFDIWRQYGVRAWPTLMFIDPRGKVIGRHEGEFALEQMDRVLREMVQQFDAEGLLDRRPLRPTLERDKERARPLSFPGKVLADESTGRLFIADSNHHRIVVSSFGGKVSDLVGSGEEGFADGPFERARFNDPQGMALTGELLYVADTKNHAIRVVDLAARTVGTVAGTGEQALQPHAGGRGESSALSSPWDVTLHDGSLYIAMAGFHQLWRLELSTRALAAHAGNGREMITDGPLGSAELAQPSGIAADRGKLYFTDSETSAIRVADAGPEGRVATIVGLGLFEFGDVDGTGEVARLQHPLGIAVHDGVLYVADTYNNKIKRASPVTRSVSTLLGSGEPGSRDGAATAAEFHEPGGLSVAAGRVWVADTNNHAVRVASLATGQVATLTLIGC